MPQPRRHRSRNPRYHIRGAYSAKSRRFGDGNLREDARIAGETQARLRVEFYDRRMQRTHPRDRVAA